MAQVCDIAVLGLGGMGSQTVMHAARGGARVIGIDQFRPPHTHGSSHGLSRLIRMAYFEQADYIPLLRIAYQLWDELQAESQMPLWSKCGLLEGGPSHSPLVQGLVFAATEYGLTLPRITTDEVRKRFPGFSLPSDWHLYFEADAGFLRPEKCIEAALEQSKQSGAQLQFDTQIHGIESLQQGVQITTSQGTVVADQVVLTLGPWSPVWRDHIPVPIQLLHKTLVWFESTSPNHDESHGCPCFLFDIDGGYYYGMPNDGGCGLKIARHDGGNRISDVTQQADDGQEVADVTAVVRDYFSPSLSQITNVAHCRYSMSPDEHFLIGASPRDDRIKYLAGLSGHGFKFASALGRLMAEWAIEGKLSPAAHFLSADRFDQAGDMP